MARKTKKGANLKKNMKKVITKQKGLCSEKMKTKTNLLNLRSFKSVSKSSEIEQTCSICIDAEDYEKVLVLKCGHHFHEICMKTWLLEQK